MMFSRLKILSRNSVPARNKCVRADTLLSRRKFSSKESANESSSSSAGPPTRQQLIRVFSHAAVPMIGFGIMDQTVMIQAGNAIDCTIGVVFGLSTLSAAAIGQICSDASGVVFGGTVERLAKAAGLPSANLSSAQTKLPIVARTAWAGSLVGIVLGCTIGLVNLFFIDTSRSSTMKLQALNDGQDFEFTVEASNAIRPDATSLKVEGPDVDGVLAAMTTALAKQGCSIVEISAKRVPAKSESGKLTFAKSSAINDTFFVVDSQTGEPFEDDQLEMVARALLESTRSPLRSLDLVRAAVVHNQMDSPLDSSFQERIKNLEHRMQVVREHTSQGADSQPRGLTRRITVVRHLPKEERENEESK